MVDGIAALTRRFQGEVWLEVLLLGGVTGIPAEVEKIASIIRRIEPARVQLNTVSRPPAEEFALPVDQDQMERFLRFFPGPVEVISENKPGKPRPARAPTVADADILALLRRRPCTVQDVSAGLRVNANEAAKRLHALSQQEVVTTVRKNDAVFYRAVRAN
jgi:wyosine [tRNA(Phe)-imidazoG37] synthetase (radical SAM superfamily)